MTLFVLSSFSFFQSFIPNFIFLSLSRLYTLHLKALRHWRGAAKVISHFIIFAVFGVSLRHYKL